MEDKKRIRSLDLIKGLLIIFTIITHYDWTDDQRRMMLFPYWIDMAVPVFVIISGYVNALSYQRKTITTIKEAYNYKEILSKYIRYTVPMLIAFAIEYVMYAVIGKSISLGKFLTGGVGPGSYYYPVMIQFIFIYPLIYFAIKEHDMTGMVVCGISNLAFELAKTLYEMPTRVYRFLVLRYIFLIAAGCYLAIGKQRIRKAILIIMFLIGTFWQYAVSYLGYKPVIINPSWATTCCISALYIIPICTCFFRSKKLMDIKWAPMELIGRASFNIFLTQMVYFIGVKKVYKIVNGILVRNLVNIAVCCIVGIIFYMIESRFAARLIRYLEERDYFDAQFNKISKKISSIFIK